ncbi:MAG: DUF4870 domain-containing protein [Anaerolineaceae bacterium]|nr:DUF4870 domain-containing protein [Anaerolineaceae bacterium]MBN2676475.1 DUF4870 domain-containing protein [Anaerolineaceae bacterium]
MTTQNVSTPEVTSDDKLWGMLSYLLNPIVPIIALLMDDKKARPFIKYHSVQALAYAVVLFVLSFILSIITLGFGGIIIGIGAFILWILWSVKAYQGEWINIPVITDFCKKQGWI